MPINDPTLLASGSNTAGSTSQTLSTFSPTGGSLLFVAFSCRSTTGLAPTNLTSTSFTDNFIGSGAWSEAGAHAETTLGISLALAYARLGPAPGTGTVTAFFGDTTQTTKAWIIGELSGVSTTTPLSESTSGNTTSPSINTLVGVLAGNLVLSAWAADATGVTTDTDFTSLSLVVTGGGTPVTLAVSYDANDDESSGTWVIQIPRVYVPWTVLAEFGQSTEVSGRLTTYIAATHKSDWTRTRFGLG